MWTRLAIAVVLTSCSGSNGQDSSDTTLSTTDSDDSSIRYTGPTALDEIVSPGCDDAGDLWIYEAATRGWTNGQNLINAWETGVDGGWNEEHDLPTTVFGPANTRDDLGRELAPGAAEAHLTRNFNTAFHCGVHDVQPIMTYAIRVYDLRGTFADCAIFSTHGQEGIDMLLSGRAPSRNPVTRAAEINSKGCAIWSLE